MDEDTNKEANLDPGILKEINRICSLDRASIVPENMAFLKARVSYLNGSQLKFLESLSPSSKVEAKEPKEAIK